MKKQIDINCDMGEGFGAYKLGFDEKIMPFITSANIACGFHAGDPLIMRATVSLAEKAGVGIGAHPGFPDIQGFGRREIRMKPEEAADYVIFQMGALQAFTGARKLQHVKPHGALYNMGAVDLKLAGAIAEAVCKFDPAIILMGLYGSAWIEAGHKAGLRVAREIFADRGYNADGTLVARNHPDAVIHDVETVVTRAIKMVTTGKVIAVNGSEIHLYGDTVCLHGDTPGADNLAQKINQGLQAAGVEVLAIGSFLGSS